MYGRGTEADIESGSTSRSTDAYKLRGLRSVFEYTLELLEHRLYGVRFTGACSTK